MNIDEALCFIRKICWQGSKPGLSRTKELLRLCGNPEDKLTFIHVAGTNGKGSFCAMMESVLRKAGLKTGLYTSPYIHSFNERMRFMGENISDEELISLVEYIKPLALSMEDRPTEFEVITVMAFLWFLKKNCDIVVLEVGLGGALDSTNVITAPVLSVLTRISLDHTQLLGETVKEIATEKAGIIKNGSTCLMLMQTKEAMDAVKMRAEEENVPVYFTSPDAIIQKEHSILGQSFDYKEYKDILLSLTGSYQRENATMVIEATKLLCQKGFNISEEALKDGLKEAHWPGRFEVLSTAPVFIIDGAHNPGGAEALRCSLEEYFPSEKFCFLMGVMADKDYSGIISKLMPLAKCFITVTPNNPRALPAEKLKEEIKKQYDGEVLSFEDIKSGVKKALEYGKAGDIITAFGSLYMSGDIRAIFGKN